MGAWGYGIYNNDRGLNAMDHYNREIENGLTKEKAFEKVEKEDYAQNNESILVYADMQVKELGYIRPYIKDNIENVIHDELNDARNWDDPEFRKEIINELYEDIKIYI